MSDSLFKVLVADDEYWIRENLRGLVDWQAHSFVFLEPAEDGEDALRRIREQRPDIVITDVSMPFLSGTELIEAAVVEQPETVFVVLSGYSDFPFVRAALVAGAVDYLLKPISKGDLLGVLAKAVDRLLTRRAQFLEEKATQEKLRVASSAAMDRDLSRLIHRTRDRQLHAQIQTRLEEYELDFSGFTCILFRTAGLARILKSQNRTDQDQLVFSLKELISAQVQGARSLVFHYTYKSNEFLLITDMEDSRIQATCEQLAALLRKATGYDVTAVISRHYFSFSYLRDAYNETLSAMLAQPYASAKAAVLRVENVDNCAVTKRIAPELEKQLLFAVASGNGDLFQKVLYEEIRLQDCGRGDWLFVEVRQTVDSISWILRNGPSGNGPQLLILDNLAELLLLAVDNFDTGEMTSILEQMLDEVFDSARQPGQSENMRQTVAQVQQYIDQNYFEELSLTQLAKQYLVESSYLSRAFKAAVGDNLMLYIAKRRMEKAKEHIRQSKLSLTEISQLVGYGDYAYFNRVFHKVTGISPREYKEREEQSRCESNF